MITSVLRAIAGACTLAVATSVCTAAAPRPNIVFLLVDDLGSADCGFAGGTEIKTPAIDALARGGTILDTLYVQPVCSPTRACLMTGRYPTRTGVYTIVRPHAPWGLPLAERTLADALRAAGYQTAISGKWHLGEFDPAYVPTARGFDRQYGHYFGALDYFTHVRDGAHDWYRDDKPIREEGYTTDLLADEACRMITKRDPSKPLFLYVPFNGVHSPYQAPPAALAPYAGLDKKRRILAGMLAAVDAGVGRIVAALEAAGIRDDTLILFCGDNGGCRPGNNGTLRDFKATLYEGGIRTCGFANWPGKVPAGARVAEPLHTVDWYPTLVRLAGGPLEDGPPLDGRDAWPVITAGAKSPHDAILVATAPDRAALRVGDWKLIATGSKRSELFDLSKDPGERDDVAATEPERLRALRSKLADMLADAVPTAAKAPPGDQPRKPKPRRAAAAPNVLIFYADDLGWGELGCQGNAEIPTPHIDSIAANGVRCTQGYVAATYCSPSRAGLMTGRYPTRFGHETNGDHDSSGFLDETTLATRLERLGYSTACVGKWHLGASPERRPTARGFQEFYGTLGNTPFHHPKQFIDSRTSADVITIDDDSFYTTDAYADRAVEWLEERAGSPWFLYLPFNAQHAPLQAPRKYLERFPGIADEKRRLFAAMLSAMDDAVGRVLATVRSLGQEDDTLVFFIADNGGPTKQTTSQNGPLRGFKMTTFEGGPRVPFLFQWKGRVPAGRTYEAPVMNLDVVPTVMAAAGRPVDAGERIDGVDLVPFLAGDAPGRPHDSLFWRFGSQWAVRSGDWKLVVSQGGSGRPELYDVAADPGEQRDLAATHPGRVAELQKAYDAWNAEQAPGRADDQPRKKRNRPRKRPAEAQTTGAAAPVEPGAGGSRVQSGLAGLLESRSR